MPNQPIQLPISRLEGILEGRTTQVRIPLIPQTDDDNVELIVLSDSLHKRVEARVYKVPFEKENDSPKFMVIPCPYGQPGGLLYVQEEWYTSGLVSQDYLLKAAPVAGMFSDRPTDRPWQPAHTMPPQAARLWLKITFVGIERVYAFTKVGAIREDPVRRPKHDISRLALAYADELGDGQSFCLNARIAFRQWVNSVHSQAVYDANPWLWAISFKRTNPPSRL